MSLKNLVDGTCSQPNALVQLTRHLTVDQSRSQDGFHRQMGFGTSQAPAEVDSMVHEFLSEHPRLVYTPQTFNMQNLLSELATIQEHEAAAQQAEGFHLPSGWADEFLDQRGPEQSAFHMQPTEDVLEAVYRDAEARQGVETNRLDAIFQEHESVVQGASAWVDESTLEGDRWVQDFQKFVQDMSELRQDGGREDYWNTMQQQWNELARGDDHPWLDEFNEVTDKFKNYQFDKENPLLEHPDPFGEGLKRLEQHDLANAVLLFEAAVQKDPQHHEAWRYLGTSQAENEQDPFAITALRKSLELDPNNLPALQCLSTCYTNESLQSQAIDSLLLWLRRNPKYSHLARDIPEESTTTAESFSSFVPVTRFNEVKNSFLKAVQSSAEIDADLQCCLGVLFSLSAEFDKASDCFRTAAQINPQDAKLWNRLGATLANNGKSDQAIEAYHRALSLNPGYIRGRYNLGISCVNLGAHREAIEHFITALNLQRQGVGPQGQKALMSTSIWATLRMAVSMMGRTDLYSVCEQQDLDRLMAEFRLSPSDES